MSPSQQPTLKQLLFDHENDYDFSVRDIPATSNNHTPSLSIVIPYYEDPVIEQTLNHLFIAIKLVSAIGAEWTYEVLLIDDGSKTRTLSHKIAQRYPNMRILIHDRNLGRTVTRNTGLAEAQKTLTLFLDSDIIVEKDILLKHLSTHSYARDYNKKIITASFFQHIESIHSIPNAPITFSDLIPNDFRIQCTYKKEWIGCKNDERFINQTFAPVHDTMDFKQWPQNGNYGPWVLPNMILGGFFMVDTRAAQQVGGFNTSFPHYGFTETSLTTKLLAIKNHYAVPMTNTGAIHIGKIGKGKDEFFKNAHDYYFNTFLGLTAPQAVDTLN